MINYIRMMTIVLALTLPSFALLADHADDLLHDEEENMIEIIYKNKAPSLETFETVMKFLEPYSKNYKIVPVIMTDPENADLMEQRRLPTEHFPFAIAINGMTSAKIDDEIIILAHFPDFMHHIGRHQGNWTLDHLATVLKQPELLIPQNPKVTSQAGGKKTNIKH